MYAVVSSGGKQYRVEAGNELVLERVPGDAGASITFDRVLLVGDGEAVTVGTPTIEGATVSGTVLGEALGPKLIVFKFKQKATYRRKNGHRQHLMRVRIDGINTRDGRRADSASAADDAGAGAPTEASAPAKKRAPQKSAAAAEPSGDAVEESKPKRSRTPATDTAGAEE